MFDILKQYKINLFLFSFSYKSFSFKRKGYNKINLKTKCTLLWKN